ncbi:hypothetical protein EVAR_7729_1 [Eumeta japonica]|uniref:Uncharacterized protein n=1 Tax=Eumeta variegata TaxID=151549 RepID=A0A4C1TIX4_EUMVA|nr:hypothetical protein EVAR_7729_1 [Eumeta japonica]
MFKEYFSVENLSTQSKKPRNDTESKALKVLDDTSCKLTNERFEVFPDVETAQQITNDINENHKSASFDLMGWASNETDALGAIESTKGE